MTNNKKFTATIYFHHKNNYLGTYATAKEAAVAYDRAVIKHKHPSCKLNFPNDYTTSSDDDSRSSSSSSSSSIPKKRKATTTKGKSKPNKKRHDLKKVRGKETLKGYRFVYKAGKRWQVRCKHRDQFIYVGVFNDKKVAARAADVVVRERGWPTSNLNFPDEVQPTRAPTPSVTGRVNTKPQPIKNKTGKKGVSLVPNTGHGTDKAAAYNVSIYKDNETYRLTEKYSDINAAADAHDKMAVALGRSAEYLNFPEKYDQHVFFNQLTSNIIFLTSTENYKIVRIKTK